MKAETSSYPISVGFFGDVYLFPYSEIFGYYHLE